MTDSILYILIFILLIIILFMIFKLFKPLAKKTLKPETKFGISESILEQNQIEFSGIVKEYASNHIEDVDKIILNCNTEKIVIHFPPHIGKQITQVINIGDTITVIVRPSRKKMYNNYRLFDLIAIKNPSSPLTLEAIKPHPPTGIPIEIKGNISSFRYNKENHISGFIINGYLVDIPPHFAETITPMLHKEKEIDIRGYKRNKKNDFINESGYEVIRPYSISIDKTDYLL